MVVAVQTEQIKCRTEGCGQVVFTVTPSGEVYPLGIRIKIERDGRLACTCPVCHARNRYQPGEKAA